MTKTWWKEAIAYQIFPKSFKDSNGDGIGDLQGVISKLDYLKDLGIDVIWICPMYKSPFLDNGYDISDYYGIAEFFGDMKDFDALLNEVHTRGMKLIIDLVVNHTSDEHPWFIESKSSKDNPKRDYYIWKDGKEDGTEPSNWESIFGGSAWEKDEETGQYYFHCFAKEQPDLNWENEEVREELYNMINWWLDKGVDGFRVDAISHIKKMPGIPDLPNPEGLKYVSSFDGHRNQPGIQDWLQELKDKTFAIHDCMTVGEANGASIEEADVWVGEEDGKFNMVIQFDHLEAWEKDGIKGYLDVPFYKQAHTKWQKGLENLGWNALFIENHDKPRIVSSWGNDQEHWFACATAYATMYMMLQGTPFIYQGQEIGMTNIKLDNIEQYDDVATKNTYRFETEHGKSHEEVMEKIWLTCRDNSRTPMQWTSSQHAGFTDGETPWFPINENYTRINVEDQDKDPQSILNYYRQLIQLRKANELFVYGTYDLLMDEHPEIYAYTRTLDNQKAVIITNISEKEAIYDVQDYALSSAQLKVHNYPVEKHEDITSITLKPYEARIYIL